MDKRELAEQYLDANNYKIRCAAIDRDAEDLVVNAFLAGYEAGHSAGVEEKLVEEMFVNVEPLLKGK